MTHYKNILLISIGSASEILLTTPVIRVLKTQLEDCKIHYVGGSSTEVLIQNPYIDQLHLCDSITSDLIDKLKSANFDLVIDLIPGATSAKLAKKLRTKTRSFDLQKLKKWTLINFKVNLLPNEHIVDRYIKMLEPLGVKMDNLGLDYFIPERDIVELSWLPESHQEEYIVFGIGAEKKTKQLPLEKIIETCDRINKPIILIGNENDQQLGDHVVDFFERRSVNKPYEEGLKELNKKSVIFNSCGKFNMHQNASIIKQARAVFVNDNIWMHIAAALGKEIFTIWGSSIPGFGAYPYRTKFTVFENLAISCRPCSINGLNSCPVGHFKCMKELVLDFYIP